MDTEGLPSPKVPNHYRTEQKSKQSKSEQAAAPDDFKRTCLQASFGWLRNHVPSNRDDMPDHDNAPKHPAWNIRSKHFDSFPITLNLSQTVP